jgi:hypothetical protein
MPFGTPIKFGYKTLVEKSKIAMLKNNFMIINLSKSSHVQWTVFDQTGRQISHFKKQLPVGLHKIQVINEAQLAKKNYLISGNIGSIPICGKVCYLP